MDGVRRPYPQLGSPPAAPSPDRVRAALSNRSESPTRPSRQSGEIQSCAMGLAAALSPVALRRGSGRQSRPWLRLGSAGQRPVPKAAPSPTGPVLPLCVSWCVRTLRTHTRTLAAAATRTLAATSAHSQQQATAPAG